MIGFHFLNITSLALLKNVVNETYKEAFVTNTYAYTD